MQMSHGPTPSSRSRASSGSVRGRAIRCGPDTRGRLARLLGLDREPLDYSVRSATWIDDHLEIEVVAAGDQGAFGLVLEKTRPERAFVAGPEVCLWIRQPQIPPQLGRRLHSVTRRMLERLPLRDLERMVAIDPDAVELQPEPHRQEESARPSPLLDGISIPTTAACARTAPELYADFFATSELRRAGCDIIDVHGFHTLVSHGDVECSYCAVCVPSPRASLVRLPVYETVRNIGRPAADRGAFDESEDPSTVYCSDMTEEDVIKGSPARIARVLRHADRHRDRDNLLVIGICLPDVMGEDLEGAVRDFSQTTSTPVYSVPASPRSWSWLARDLLRTKRLALPSGEAPDRRAVNLIGFSRNAGTRELTSLLQAAGVSVKTQLLPDLDMAAVARIPRAAVNVYLPNIHWEKSYEHLRDDPARRHLVIDGPHGLQGTRAWLEQVCAATGVECDVVRLCAERFEPLQARWDDLRRQASEYRLGLVVPAHEVETLLDPRHSWGIALTRVLREMGFGLDLFVGSDEAAEAFRARTSLDESDYSLNVFDSLPGLIEALRASPCQAVFSNYMFDWRLLQTGKAPFSTLEFEYGLSGAIATLQRLVEVCRIPLFRLGQRFMGAGGLNAR